MRQSFPANGLFFTVAAPMTVANTANMAVATTNITTKTHYIIPRNAYEPLLAKSEIIELNFY